MMGWIGLFREEPVLDAVCYVDANHLTGTVEAKDRRGGSARAEFPIGYLRDERDFCEQVFAVGIILMRLLSINR